MAASLIPVCPGGSAAFLCLEHVRYFPVTSNQSLVTSNQSLDGLGRLLLLAIICTKIPHFADEDIEA